MMTDSSPLVQFSEKTRAMLSASELATLVTLYQRRGGVGANATDVASLLVELEIAIPMGNVVYDIIDEIVSTAFDAGQQISLVLPVAKVVELLERLKAIFERQSAEDEHRGSISIAAVNLLQHRSMRNVTAEQILMNAEGGGEMGDGGGMDDLGIPYQPFLSLKNAFTKKSVRASVSPTSVTISSTADHHSFQRRGSSSTTMVQREDELGDDPKGLHDDDEMNQHVDWHHRAHSTHAARADTQGEATGKPPTMTRQSSSLASTISAETVMTTLGAAWYHHVHEGFDDAFAHFHEPDSTNTSSRHRTSDHHPAHSSSSADSGGVVSTALATGCGYPRHWDWDTCLLIHMDDLLAQVPAIAKDTVLQAITRRVECLSHPTIRPAVPAVLLDRSLLTLPDFSFVATQSGLVYAELNRAVLRVQSVCRTLKQESSVGVMQTATEQAVAAHNDTTGGIRLGIALKRTLAEAEQARIARDRRLKTQFGNVTEATSRQQRHPLPAVKPTHHQKPPITPKSTPRATSLLSRNIHNQNTSGAKSNNTKGTAKISPPSGDDHPSQNVVVPSRPNTARTSRAARHDGIYSEAIPPSSTPGLVRPYSSTLLSSFFSDDSTAAAAMNHAISDLEAAHLKMVAQWTHPSSSSATPACLGRSTPRGAGTPHSASPPAPKLHDASQFKRHRPASASNIHFTPRHPITATQTTSNPISVIPIHRGAGPVTAEEKRRSNVDDDEEIDMSLAEEVETTCAAALRARRFAAGRVILRFFQRVKVVQLRKLFLMLGERYGRLVHDAPVVQQFARAKISSTNYHSKIKAHVENRTRAVQRIARGFSVRKAMREMHRPRWLQLSKPCGAIQAAGRGYLSRRLLFAVLEDERESHFLDNMINMTMQRHQSALPPSIGGGAVGTAVVVSVWQDNNPLDAAAGSGSASSPLSRVSSSRRNSDFMFDDDARFDAIMEQLAPDRHLVRKLSTGTSTPSSPRHSAATSEVSLALQQLHHVDTSDAAGGGHAMHDFQQPSLGLVTTVDFSGAHVADGPLAEDPAGKTSLRAGQADAFADSQVLDEVVAAVAMDYDAVGSANGSRSNSMSTNNPNHTKWLDAGETMDTLEEDLLQMSSEVMEGKNDGDGEDDVSKTTSNNDEDIGRAETNWGWCSSGNNSISFGETSEAVPAAGEKALWTPDCLPDNTRKASTVTFDNEEPPRRVRRSTVCPSSYVPNRKASLTDSFQISLLVQIQSSARGFISRRRLGLKFHFTRRKLALRMIHRVCRGFRARIKFGMLHSSIVESNEEMLLWERRDVAARLLQRCVRRMVAGLKVSQRRQDAANGIRFRVEAER